jgi:hypothetical protein
LIDEIHPTISGSDRIILIRPASLLPQAQGVELGNRFARPAFTRQGYATAHPLGKVHIGPGCAVKAPKGRSRLAGKAPV